MAAESGLNSFPARLQETAFAGNVSELPCLVQGAPLSVTAACPPGSGELGTLLLGPDASGSRAELRVVALHPESASLTLRSVGHDGSGARTTLLQDFRLRRPVQMEVAPPAAFSACGEVVLRGRARFVGVGVNRPEGPVTRSGVLAGVTTLVSGEADRVLPGAPPITAHVADARLLDSGSVVQIGHSTFEVLGRTEDGSNALQLAALVVPPGGERLSAGRAVDLVPSALRAPPIPLNAGALRLPLTDASGFRSGDLLALQADGVTYGATVSAQGLAVPGDPASGYVDVQPTWPGDGNEAATPLSFGTAQGLARGTPLWRPVPGASTARPLTPPGENGAFSWPVAGPGLDCGEALFLRVFGRPKREVFEGAVRADALSGPVAPGVHWIGPRDPTARAALSLPGGLCGEGLVIVAGDLSLNGANRPDCSEDGSGFRGLLYVMGHLNVQGASDILGAVVVEGSAPDGVTRPSTLHGALNVTYDEAALLQAGHQLTPPELQAVPGSWRSR